MLVQYGKVIEMNEKKSYEDGMERNQIKNAIINCAKTHGKSLSEFASAAGVSPSTLTGFVNDISTRADHILSMRTIAKLTKAFPDLATFLQIAEPITELQEVRILGLVDFSNEHRIVALDPSSPGSVMIQNQRNNYVAYGVKEEGHLYHRRIYYCITEKIIYENYKNYLTKLCVIDSEKGRFLGYLFTNKHNEYYLAQMSKNEKGFESVVDKLGKINWLMPIDWIQP